MPVRSLRTTILLGTETRSIDRWGRIKIWAAMPSAASAGESRAGHVLTGRRAGCLTLYPSSEWKRVESRLRGLSAGDEGRPFVRALLADACRVTVDARGRITIPRALLTRAGLGRRATLLGMADHLEIWNPGRLRRKLAQVEPEVGRLAQEVLGEE